MRTKRKQIESDLVRLSRIIPIKVRTPMQEDRTLKKEGIRDDEIEAIKWAKKRGFY